MPSLPQMSSPVFVNCRSLYRRTMTLYGRTPPFLFAVHFVVGLVVAFVLGLDVALDLANCQSLIAICSFHSRVFA